MQEKMVVALRTIYDALSATSTEITNLHLTPMMKQYVKAARMRYSQYLEDIKKTKMDDQKIKKWKVDEFNHLEKKKWLLDGTVQSMCNDASELEQKAEKKHDFTLLSKSNAFRQKVCDKADETLKVEKKLKELRDKLKCIE